MNNVEHQQQERLQLHRPLIPVCRFCGAVCTTTTREGRYICSDPICDTHQWKPIWV